MQLAVVQIKAARVAHKCGLCARGEHDFFWLHEVQVVQEPRTLGTGLSRGAEGGLKGEERRTGEERVGDRHSASYEKGK